MSATSHSTNCWFGRSSPARISCCKASNALALLVIRFRLAFLLLCIMVYIKAYYIGHVKLERTDEK